MKRYQYALRRWPLVLASLVVIGPLATILNENQPTEAIGSADFRVGLVSRDLIRLPAGNLRMDRNFGSVDPQSVISIPAHTGEITDVAFSPTGPLVATASTDGSIKLWDVRDGSLLRTLIGHTAGVRSLAFSPSGDVLISGSDDRSAKLWNVSDGSLQRDLAPLLESRVVKVEFSPDGALIALGGNRCVVELRHASTGILSRTIVPWGCSPGNSGGPVEYWGLEFTQDGSQVLTGDGRPCCGGGSIQRWELGDYSAPEFLPTGTLVVRDIALSKDESEIALALVGSSEIWMLDALTGERKRTLSDHSFRVNDIEYSTDGSLLASASNDARIGIWRAADGVLLDMLEKHRWQVTAVAFSPDGRTLASGSQNGVLLIWNLDEALSSEP